MLKKDIKAFFKAIRAGDIQTVKQCIETDVNYLGITNFSPPKMDDGQSGLQIAFRSGQFEIGELLLHQGANVNFQETSEINEWTAPVLHDCIRAVIFNCLTIQTDRKKFEKGFDLLMFMLKNGADPNATDSYGNNCLNRWFLDSRQMIDHPNFNQNEETLKQLRRISRALIDAGADITQSTESRENVVEQIKIYRMEKYDLLPSRPVKSNGWGNLVGSLFKSAKKST
ncbi:hypothetical protein [Pedobacter sp.]|uniref:ankyrin repeat domain-containing protein n=1 Tax=Pedobacter sp. TaxID=1411316 RepID=UPI0031CEAE44